MKQNRNVFKRRVSFAFRVSFLMCLAAMGVAVAAGMIGNAQASEVTVGGTFTSFASDIHDPSVRTYFVNGVQLTSSGSPGSVSPPYYLSNTVNFTGTTSTVTFNYGGIPYPGGSWIANSFEFIPTAPVDVVMGETFLLGTLRFTNGQYSPHTAIGITLSTQSTDTALNNHIFSGTVILNSTSTDPDPVTNLINPVAEADYFYFLGNEALGSGRVYDLFARPLGGTNVGDFGLYGHIGSLDLDSLVALSGGFTTNSTVNTAGTPVYPGTTSPVPEPSTMLLMGSGLVGLVEYGRRRFKK